MIQIDDPARDFVPLGLIVDVAQATVLWTIGAMRRVSVPSLSPGEAG
jgi:hypothetical protein